MTIRLTLAPHGRTESPRAVDVVVDAQPETPMATLAARLRAAVGAPEGTVLHTATSPLPLTGTLAESRLENGTILGVGAPPPRWETAAGPTLAVISGPDAGAFVPLTARHTVIGRDSGCDLTLTDPETSRRHAVVTSDSAGVWLADAGSTNGTRLRGASHSFSVTDTPVQLPLEIPVSCGNNLLAIVEPEAPPLSIVTADPGFIDVRRPPRLMFDPPDETVHYPPQPQPLPSPVTSWLTVGFGAACSLILGLLWWWFAPDTSGAAAGMLGIMAISPVLFLVQAAIERWSRRRDDRAARAERSAAADAANRRAREVANTEAARRRSRHPDPVRVAAIAAGPTGRLWERRPDESDWLELRIGLADLPARFTVSRPERAGAAPTQERPVLPSVPATVKLNTAGVLGIAGAGRYQLAWWLIAQLAVLHSPRDLRLAFLTHRRSDAWRRARWFPHGRELGIASCGSSRAAVVAGLTAQFRRRTSTAREAHVDSSIDGSVVLLLDEADRLPNDAAVIDMLRSGHTGVFAICLAEEEHLLPEYCQATVEVTSAGRATLRVGGTATIAAITADLVTAEWLESVARAVAPLRECRPIATDPPLPRRPVALDVLLGLSKPPTETDPTMAWAKTIAERWRTTPRDVTVPLGVGGGGPVVVNLVADGPHALVAGTTGAGKSELLRTWLIGLAVANRPEELSMLLIDYKGGAAFAECAGLPHTAGLVTDLDTALTARVLRSLAAELRRRERAFVAVGVGDLSEYQRLRDHGDHPAVPRLLVVIDEFAALAEEFPELIAGLVDLARRGRSLGMHLVLATQRPAGVISAQIRANTALRICLRVTDPDDSADVVGSGVAAEIAADLPGRAYLRRQGELVSVQVAHVSGSHPTASDNEESSPLRVAPVPWHSAAPPRTVDPEMPRQQGATTLSTLVRAVGRAAVAIKAGPVPPPWLPPLPDRLLLPQLRGSEGGGAPFGLRDLPHEQTQLVYRIDLADPVQLAIIGGPGSGKTSALRTLAASVASTYSPREVRIFAFDHDGGLSDLARLPHCDAVVERGDFAHAQRVWRRLWSEIQRRAQYSLAATEPPAPWLLVLVDSWNVADDGFSPPSRAPASTADRVLREGARHGLRTAIAGGRTLLAPRFMDLFTRKLLLRLPRRDDYALADIPGQEVPDDVPPGRALIAGTPVTQLQLATLDEAEPSTQQVAFRKLAAELSERWPNAPAEVAMPVRALPQLVTTAELSHDGEPWSFPVGIGGDTRESVSLRLVEHRVAVVAGPPGSGKTTALLAVARAAVRRRIRVIMVTARADAAHPVVPDLILTRTSDELLRVTADASSALVLADDVDLVLDATVGETLADLVSQARHRVVLAGNVDELLAAFRGCVVRARRSRTGLLLAAGPGDGELLGLPRDVVPEDDIARPGRGILVQHGTPTHVQIALPAVDNPPAVEIVRAPLRNPED